MFSSLLVLSLAALAPLANANLFITSPVATSTIPAGKNFTIVWQEDNAPPTLASIGPATFGLYVGNVNVQTQLQTIATVDVSKVSSLSWAPDPSVGPNSNAYFIRVTSVSLKDANNSQYNAEAFSSKFTLTDMTGTFNSTMQAEISGSAAAPTGPPAAGTAAAGASGSGSPSSSAAAAASSVKPKTSASASSAAGSSSNSAGPMVVPRVLGATGVAAIVFAFFL